MHTAIIRELKGLAVCGPPVFYNLCDLNHIANPVQKDMICRISLRAISSSLCCVGPRRQRLQGQDVNRGQCARTADLYTYPAERWWLFSEIWAMAQRGARLTAQLSCHHSGQLYKLPRQSIIKPVPLRFNRIIMGQYPFNAGRFG